MGVMDQATPRVQSSAFVNPMLRQAKEMMESLISPEYLAPIARELHAGIKILYAPQTKDLVGEALRTITRPQQVPDAVGRGIVTVVKIIFQEANGKMPAASAWPAMQILLCYLLDDVQAVRGIEITKPMLAASLKQVNYYLGAFFGIDQAKINEALQAVKTARTAPRQGAA